MRVFFLIAAFIPFILTVEAQKSESQYTCEINHKDSEVVFYLPIGKGREIQLGGWKVLAGLRVVEGEVELSLSRAINVTDATYEKGERQRFHLNEEYLRVELNHQFGGVNDHFSLSCRLRQH